jgi:hypothetical protein
MNIQQRIHQWHCAYLPECPNERLWAKYDEEVKERDANPKDRSEYADVQIVLYELASRNRFDLDKTQPTSFLKMKILNASQHNRWLAHQHDIDLDAAVLEKFATVEARSPEEQRQRDTERSNA